MLKKFLIISLFIGFNCYGQNNIFLIGGFYNQSTYLIENYKLKFYKLNNGNILNIRESNKDLSIFSTCYFNPDYNIYISAFCDNNSRIKKITLSKLKNNIIDFDSIKIKYFPDFKFIQGSLYYQNDFEIENIMVPLYNTKIKENEILIGIKTNTHEIFKSDTSFYYHCKYNGHFGNALWFNNGFSFKYYSKDSIMMPVTFNKNNWIPFNIKFDDSIKFTKNMSYSYSIDNDNMIAINFCSDQRIKKSKLPNPNQEILTDDTLLIINKKTNKSYYLKQKGNYNKVCSFGKYLAGLQCQSNIKQGALPISPGMEVRNFKKRDTGPPFDERAAFEYYPGVLYIMNTETGEYYEWDTKQGDSCILYVLDGMIYYRVYDKIYKRTFGNGKLGLPELLVHDNNEVPNIHWMMIGE